MSDGLSASARQSATANTGVIVLFGVRGSGKDTIADRLVSLYGFRKNSFAGPMKQMCEIAFPKIPRDHWYGPSPLRETPCLDYEFSGPCLDCGTVLTRTDGPMYWACPKCESVYPQYVTPRLALQSLGTEWGQRLHKPMWAKSALHQATSGTCITDGRFRHELDAAHAAGALCVLLMRGREESMHQPNTHISEQIHQLFKLEEFHVCFHNDKYTLDTLDSGVEGLVDIAKMHTRFPQHGRWDIKP